MLANDNDGADDSGDAFDENCGDTCVAVSVV